ncbi:hypothetical protein V8E54_010888 [Elaphomyces granulatus]
MGIIRRISEENNHLGECSQFVIISNIFIMIVYGHYYYISGIRLIESRHVGQDQSLQELEHSGIVVEAHSHRLAPQLPIFEDVPDPSALQPQTQEPPPEEKEEDVPAGWPKDPTTLDFDVCKPVWTKAHTPRRTKDPVES